MTESPPVPLARSAVEPAPPVRVEHGWEMSGRAAVGRGATTLRLTDYSPVTKTSLRAEPSGRIADAVAVPVGTARRDGAGALVAAIAPGEWLAFGSPGLGAWPPIMDDGLATVVDVTHGLTVLAVAGAASASLLSKLCAVDLHDSVTPSGSALRSLVAGVVAGVIRDDEGGQPRYLVFCERSVGQYLFDALLDAGAEFHVDVDGFPADPL